MAASRVINQQSFHDGKLVLYQLENRPKQLWLCRIKVPNGTGYIYRGTGTSDFYEARKFADDLLDEIRIKTKLGQSITGPNLAKMAADFEAHAKAKGEPAKRDLAIIAFLETYAVPYFTKNKVTDLNQKEIGKFFDWRRVNSKRKAPKETTILHETSMFSTFLKWCHRRGHLDREIRIERPKQDGVPATALRRRRLAEADSFPSGMGQAGRAQVGADLPRPSDADELRSDPRQHRRSGRGGEGTSLAGRGVRTDGRPRRGQHHRPCEGQDRLTGGRRPHAGDPDVF